MKRVTLPNCDVYYLGMLIDGGVSTSVPVDSPEARSTDIPVIIDVSKEITERYGKYVKYYQ